MKFAIDIRGVSSRPAGKERYVLSVVRQLAALDTVNSYYLFSDKREVLPFDLPKNFKSRVEVGLGPWWHVRIAQLIADEGIDGYLSALSYLVPALTDGKTLLVVHDLAIFTHPETTRLKTRLLEQWALRRAVRKAKQVVCDSESTKRELLRFIPEVKRSQTSGMGSTIEVIHLGVDKEFRPIAERNKRQRVTKKYQLPSHFLLFVGTLEPRKNIPTLIEAFWLLPQSIRRQYEVVLVGKKGWKYKEIFSAIRHLGLSDSVRHLDYVDRSELPTIYSLAELFVLPSLSEGFGFPVLEAMSCGTPVVTSNTSSLPEIVGRAGLLVPPDDPKALSRAILRVVSESKLRQKLRRLGLQQVKKFSWQKTATELHQLLLEIGRDSR